MTTTALRHVILIQPSFESWRDAVRPLLAAAISPDAVDIADTSSAPTRSLFPSAIPFSHASAAKNHVPRSFIERAR